MKVIFKEVKPVEPTFDVTIKGLTLAEWHLLREVGGRNRTNAEKIYGSDAEKVEMLSLMLAEFYSPKSA